MIRTEARRKIGEDVELRVEGLASVDVLGAINPGPAKGLALFPLEPRGVDSVGMQERDVVFGEVVAYHRDDARVGEVAARDGEVGGGAAQGVVAAPGRRAHRIVGHGPNYQEGHAVFFNVYLP